MTADVPVPHLRRPTGELRLDPRTHGKGRVPGPKVVGFDLPAFARSMEERDTAYQASQYAADADIRIVDPDHPPSAPRAMHGRPEIEAWLAHLSTTSRGLQVSHLIDGGDRVGFTERWHHDDGSTAVASSTAELDGGQITMRHTVVVWDRDPP